MTPAEWHAEALRLADEMSDGAADAESSRNFARYNNARAALSAHLLAYPVGEVVAYVFAPDLELLRDEPSMLLTVLQQPSEPGFITPLYRNPKESA